MDMKASTDWRKRDWLLPLVQHVTLPVAVAKDHPGYGRYLREFEATQYWSRAEIEALQTRRLRALLTHAAKHCPFYAARFRQAGFSPETMDSFDQFYTLPRLTKSEIQKYGAEMTATNQDAAKRVRNQTGGSTGSPLQFWVDRERFTSRKASTTRHNRWAGMNPGDWLAVLWGARLDLASRPGLWGRLRNELVGRQIELNTSRLREEDWQAFIRMLRQKRPRFLLAYAQSAVLFARYLRERGVSDIHFESVITTAEVLSPGQREEIEAAFHAEVFNRYGCREVSVIASECSCHSGLHVNAEALLVEIEADPEIPAPSGKVLVTDLLNYSMPLIRYEIGDVAAWARQQSCPCGRGLPLLEDIRGRITDFIELRDGTRISGPALTLVIADMADVSQVQFVQKDAGLIELRVVPGKSYGLRTRDELKRRLGAYVGDQARIEISDVPAIRSESSGKYRFVINQTVDANRTGAQ
jgi:phenylacetate-CoA ligase